jgi:hypothetical protein
VLPHGVGLLQLAAAEGCEVLLAHELAGLLENRELPDLQQLRERFRPRTASLPSVSVVLPALSAYDALVEVA